MLLNKKLIYKILHWFPSDIFLTDLNSWAIF